MTHVTRIAELERLKPKLYASSVKCIEKSMTWQSKVVRNSEYVATPCLFLFAHRAGRSPCSERICVDSVGMSVYEIQQPKIDRIVAACTNDAPIG